MKKELNHLAENIKEIKTQLITMISNLPDATPGVKMLSKNCAIVSFSTIAANRGILSPSYYINAENKKVLIERIERSNVENLRKLIEDIIDKGTINDTSGQTTRVSPEFVKALKEKWL